MRSITAVPSLSRPLQTVNAAASTMPDEQPASGKEASRGWLRLLRCPDHSMLQRCEDMGSHAVRRDPGPYRPAGTPRLRYADSHGFCSRLHAVLAENDS